MSADATVLVTGGTGFIGSRLVAELARRNFRVFVLDDFSASGPDAIDLMAGDITLYGGCVTNRKLTQKLLSFGVSYVVHLATRNITTSQIDPVSAFGVNSGGTFDLLVDAAGANVRRVVFTSTTSVYDDSVLPMVESGPVNPKTIYSISKRGAEACVPLVDIPVTMLRLSNVYGPGQTDTSNPYCGVIGHFMRAAMNNQPLTVFGDGKDTRDYTYIDDVVNALILSMLDIKSDGASRDSFSGNVYNIGTGVEVSVSKLAEMVRMVTGMMLPIDHRTPRTIDVIRRRVVDAGLFRKDFGWEPRVTLENGLRNTWEHWNATHRN